jgi:hypothetical protein
MNMSSNRISPKSEGPALVNFMSEKMSMINLLAKKGEKGDAWRVRQQLQWLRRELRRLRDD